MGRFTALVGPFRQYPDSVAGLISSLGFGQAIETLAIRKLPRDWKWLVSYWSAFSEDQPRCEETFTRALAEAANPADRVCLLVNLMIDGHFNPPRGLADEYRHEVVSYFQELARGDNPTVFNKRDLAIMHLNALELLCQVFCYRMDEEMHLKLMRIYYQIAFRVNLAPSLRVFAVEGFYHALRLSARMIRRRPLEWRFIEDSPLDEIRRCHESSKQDFETGDTDPFEEIWSLIGGMPVVGRTLVGGVINPPRNSFVQPQPNA